jgi:DNA-binding IclR family transcriptional regulator
VALGRVAADQFGLGELARPFMQHLRDACGESVQLYVREDDARRCMVSLQSPHALRWIVAEGSVLPLGVGSAGRVLTGEPVADRGWIESVEEREAGVASVSAPVRDLTGAIVAAVGVSGPIERLTRSPGERFGTKVADAARQIGDAVALAR